MNPTTVSGTYEMNWDSTNVVNGYHQITVRAADFSNNQNSDSIDVYVENSGTVPPPTTDTNPPVLIVKQPKGNDMLQGEEDLSVLVYEDTKLDRVEYSIVFGTSNWHRMTNAGNNEWIGRLNTENYPDGDYSLVFQAVDSAGNKASESITIDIQNGFYDITKPTLKALSPSKGDIVTSDVEITAEANDDFEISEVEYRIDSGEWTQMLNVRNNVYQSTLRTTDFDDGSHILTIRATDLSDNVNEITLDIEFANTEDKPIETESGLPGFTGMEVLLVMAVLIIVLGSTYRLRNQ
jgi:hypothetical protein